MPAIRTRRRAQTVAQNSVLLVRLLIAFRLLDDLIKGLALLYHAELGTGAILDRRQPLFQIQHLGFQRLIAFLKTGIFRGLRDDLLPEIQQTRHPPGAKPERILQQQ